jgi:hypothetical protein
MVEATKDANIEVTKAKEEAGEKKLHLDEVTGEMISKR